MIKEIINTAESLSERAPEWDIKAEKETLDTLTADFTDTLIAADRAWLIAPMIGYKVRSFALRAPDGVHVFNNPLFAKKEQLIWVREKPLYSDDDTLEYFVPRWNKVTINYQDNSGNPVASEFTDTAAQIVSQIMDLLEGVDYTIYSLPIDKPMQAKLKKATEEEVSELLDWFRTELATAAKNLDEDLTNNEETSQEWGALKYMRAVQDGEVTLISEEELNKKSATKQPALNRKSRRAIAKLIKKLGKK